MSCHLKVCMCVLLNREIEQSLLIHKGAGIRVRMLVGVRRWLGGCQDAGVREDQDTGIKTRLRTLVSEHVEMLVSKRIEKRSRSIRWVSRHWCWSVSTRATVRFRIDNVRSRLLFDESWSVRSRSREL